MGARWAPRSVHANRTRHGHRTTHRALTPCAPTVATRSAPAFTDTREAGRRCTGTHVMGHLAEASAYTMASRVELQRLGDARWRAGAVTWLRGDAVIGAQ